MQQGGSAKQGQLILLLGCLTMLGPLSIDFYLPALPVILSSGYDHGHVMAGTHDELPQILSLLVQAGLRLYRHLRGA